MIGIIGGTGVYEIVTMGDEIDKKVLKTPYGILPKFRFSNFMDTK